jgi:hypothetical protein
MAASYRTTKAFAHQQLQRRLWVNGQTVAGVTLFADARGVYQVL